MRPHRVPVLLVLALAAPATAAPARSAAPQAPPAAAADLGSWSLPVVPEGVDPETIGVHTVLLHTGKVLVLGQNVVTSDRRATRAYLYDPRTGTGRPLRTPPDADLECAGVAHLADGRVLLAGGHGVGNTGPRFNHLFDPISLTFTRQPDSVVGRFYPTVVRLPDERLLVLGGKDEAGRYTPHHEVYTPPPRSRSVGRLEPAGAPHAARMYARTWVMPDGKALVAVRDAVATITPGTWEWSGLPTSATGDDAPTGALLPGPASGPRTVLMTGGARATTQLLRYGRDAQWTPAQPLPEARTHMSPVLLPDGTLLGVGGNAAGKYDTPHHSTLRFDPSTGAWTRLAAQSARRAYHSSAVLLPDGRVLSAGDNGLGGGRATVEVFSPPYLSAASRPVIAAVPRRVARGSRFPISTTSTGVRAVLMAPGAATHTLDMNARSVRLQVVRTADGLSAAVPSRNAVPSGWYMLFLVDRAGTPSVARWVRISG